MMSAQPASASSIELIGLSSSTPGTLYDINRATGAATKLVDITGDAFTSIVGLASLNGTLYATDVFANTFSFGSINLATGAFTSINNQAGDSNWWNLTSNEAGGFFYVVNSSGTLDTVTPTGVITGVGGTGHSFGGLAYDNASSILYGTASDNNLYRINTTTGAATLVGALGISPSNSDDIAIDPLTGTLYLNAQNTHSLYTVNTSTGAATLVGANGPTEGRGIDGLAFNEVGATAVPEPATMLLVGSGLVVAVRRRRRRA